MGHSQWSDAMTDYEVLASSSPSKTQHSSHSGASSPSPCVPDPNLPHSNLDVNDRAKLATVIYTCGHHITINESHILHDSSPTPRDPAYRRVVYHEDFPCPSSQCRKLLKYRRRAEYEVMGKPFQPMHNESDMWTVFMETSVDEDIKAKHYQACIENEEHLEAYRESYPSKPGGVEPVAGGRLVTTFGMLKGYGEQDSYPKGTNSPAAEKRLARFARRCKAAAAQMLKKQKEIHAKYMRNTREIRFGGLPTAEAESERSWRTGDPLFPPEQEAIFAAGRPETAYAFMRPSASDLDRQARWEFDQDAVDLRTDEEAVADAGAVAGADEHEDDGGAQSQDDASESRVDSGKIEEDWVEDEGGSGEFEEDCAEDEEESYEIEKAEPQTYREHLEQMVRRGYDKTMALISEGVPQEIDETTRQWWQNTIW